MAGKPDVHVGGLRDVDSEVLMIKGLGRRGGVRRGVGRGRMRPGMPLSVLQPIDKRTPKY